MGAHAKKKPKSTGKKRIVDLEVEELSVVDKPAIGEGFFLIKRADGTADEEATKEALMKGSHWLTKNKSEISKVGVCHFCKEEGGSEPKIGLRCGVCFSCAVERQAKGVFDECLEGSFDIVSYKEKYGEESMSKSDEDAKKEGDESKEDQAKPEQDQEEKKPDDENQEASEDSESDEKSDDKEEDSQEDSSEEGDGKEEPQKTAKMQNPSTVEEVIKLNNELRKNNEELQGLLEQMLVVGENNAESTSVMMGLVVSALELTALSTDGQDEQSDEQEAEVASASRLSEIVDEIKAFKSDISKSGAKISQSRLKVLQEIAEKLSDLLHSVTERKKDGKRRKKHKSDGLVSRIKSLENSIEAIRSESTDKFGDLAKKINDLENTAGASDAIDDELDENGIQKKDSSQSIFKDVIGMNDIKMSIAKRKSYLGEGGDT